METILQTIPQLTAIIEKGGIVGLLVIICGFLLWQLIRYQKELSSTYRQRDRWRLAFVKAKSVCDGANLKVDLTDLADLLESP